MIPQIENALGRGGKALCPGAACYGREMPTVLRLGPYRFHFYSRENREPAHIHVSRDNLEAKFWLEPIAVAFNRGYPLPELKLIRRHVERHCHELIVAYREFHEQ